MAASLLLASCVLGPQYAVPPVPPAATGGFAGVTAATDPATPPPDHWWRLYDDPALDALVGQALVANTDLRVAEANLRRARALLAEARVQLFPLTQLGAQGGYARTAASRAGPAGNSQFYGAGFDVSYEVDLFGRVRNSVRAARADAEAVAAQRDATRVTVAAETARAYADACSGAAQLDVARNTLGLQTQTFDLTERQAQAGRGNPTDVERARAQLESVRATVPIYAAARRNALSRLAVLTGQPPEVTLPAAEACRTAPLLRSLIPVGDGTALLQRRPDVRAADRTLAAQTARIGVATAGLYPSISLGGSVSTAGNSIGALGRSSSVAFSFGPLISWTFPNIGAARAQIAQARASAEGALASFDGTVLNALQETEIALTNYAGELDRNAALQRARDHSAEAVRIFELRYRYGADSFLNVLDAQRTLADNQAALAASTAALSDDQVALFKALGGGWQMEEVAAVAVR